ncbi:ATP-dependent metallopeptidase HflB [Stomatobaculum longum]|uniref:ATP-dependent zinc metalloprotease FtsH n=1 Tax=Stomatobaculum longum TaxID=796942 RepID=A0AA36Y3G0_9FIRM|nr:ATP-dependent zinc metalloprotease FtsH [Stomatobaculum longum]EHO15757.1 ATP-dependent metallopeptidase HflB [Stomatobaculum longum]
MSKRKRDEGGLYRRLRDLILGGDDADTEDFALPEELQQKYRKICEELKACPPEERESKRKELEAKYHIEISFDPETDEYSFREEPLTGSLKNRMQSLGGHVSESLIPRWMRGDDGEEEDDEEYENPEGGDPGDDDGNRGGRGFGSLLFPLLMLLAVVMLFFNLLLPLGGKRNSAQVKEVSYTEFLRRIDEKSIVSAKIGNSVIRFDVKPEGKKYTLHYVTTRMDSDRDLPEKLYQAGAVVTRERFDIGGLLLSGAALFLPVILIFVAMNFLIRRMGVGGGGGGFMGGVTKSNAKIYVQKETGVTFADVAGEDEAKESLTEIVDFLHNPERFREIGAKLPKGALLVGPPGTGKTLLAKAVAGEANVPFFSLSGSDFVEMYVGVGASRVRDLFRQAQEAAPCIIFIDEIDAIGKSRDSRYGGGNDEREQTLNQLLSEMDGFDSSKGLLVLGATNRPEILDPALLRPGRFDRRVIVERPDLKGRIEILKVHAKDVMLDDTVDFDAIGLATSGAVGSELANMVNEAAILAVKNGRKAVSQKDLFESVEVVLVGKEKKDRVMNQKERRIVSYHEVGHALISALQKNAEPVQKITIVPRTMGALGYVMYVPEEETYLMSKKELEERLVSTLGGRAAEELVFGDVTTGAQNDIEQATNIAKSMVTMYGMSESFGLMGLARVENQYLSGRTVMDCSDQTAAQVDKEVERILKEAYQTALQLLRENRMVLDQIADFLINRETITGKEFMRILRKVKNLPTPLSEQEPILI